MLHIGKLIGIGKEREIKYDTQPLRLRLNGLEVNGGESTHRAQVLTVKE